MAPAGERSVHPGSVVHPRPERVRSLPPLPGAVGPDDHGSDGCCRALVAARPPRGARRLDSGEGTEDTNVGTGYAWSTCPSFADCLYTSQVKKFRPWDAIINQANI